VAAQIARRVLRAEKINTHREINVVFIDNKTIRSLSRRFLGEDHDTDVIAFPYESGPFGDIYISLPMAKYNAARFNENYKTEVVRLIIHGTLHMLGYDDHQPKAKKIMWQRQEKLVKKLKDTV
jgi:probable rRNA maturation factor